MKTSHVVCAVSVLLSPSILPGSETPKFSLALSTVPAGGAGPAYTFKIGQFEITNRQFAAFLNDAEANQANARGANLLFDASGDVGLTAGYSRDAFYDVSDNCDSRTGGACPVITYTRGLPVGQRYAVATGYEDLPVGGVSWLGAVKFCNWLTIDQGRGEDQRCYSEGAAEDDWHPVVIDTISWKGRDLDDAERARLVADYRGFRLPMDNVGYANGPLGGQENEYNEWYKAAAYDPAAPDTERSGPGNERVSPDHWIYADGRDTKTNPDSNFRNSRDAYEPWLTPAGYYNGENLMGDDRTYTNDTNNPWQLYDLSGNALEWVQDQCLLPNQRALRGGSFDDGSGGMSAANRTLDYMRSSSPDIGLRVMVVEDCSVEVRSTEAIVDQELQDRVSVKVRLNTGGSNPAGWVVTVLTTEVYSGREKIDDLRPSNSRGLAKRSLKLRSGTYVLEVIDIHDPYGYECMPDDCRHCLAVFVIP